MGDRSSNAFGRCRTCRDQRLCNRHGGKGQSTSSVQTLGVSTVGSRASKRACGLSLLDEEAPGIDAELFLGRGWRLGVCHNE